MQGIGTLAAGVALGVLATSTYFRLWDRRPITPEEALLRFSPELTTQNIRRLDPNFAVCYDRRTRVALWTLEHLTRDTITMGKNVDRGNSVFREDNQIHPFFRSTNQDYSGKLKEKGPCNRSNLFFSRLGLRSWSSCSCCQSSAFTREHE